MKKLQWEVVGDSMVAWVNGLVMYEIAPNYDAPIGYQHGLTLDYVAEGRSTFMGWYQHLGAAQRAADRHESLTLRHDGSLRLEP